MRLDRFLFIVALAMLAMPAIVGGDGALFPFIGPKVRYAYAVTALVVTGVAWLAWRRPAFRLPSSPLLWALGVQAVIVLVSTAAAVDPSRAWWGTVERMMGASTLLAFSAWAVAAACLVRTRARWDALALATVVSVVLVTPIGCWAVGMPSFRFSGAYGNPSYVAEAQVLLIAVSALLAWRRRVALVGVAVGLFVLGMAGTRGAMVGLGVGAAVALFIGRPSAWFALWGAVPVAAVAAFIGQNFDSLGFRWNLWRHAWRAIWQYPILGWGPDSFGLLFASTLQLGQMAIDRYDQAHNVLIDTGATTGLRGLLAHVAVWVGFSLTLRLAYRRGALARAEAAMLAGAGVAIETSRLVLFDHPTGALSVAILFALTMSAGRGFSPAPERTRRCQPV